MACSWNFKAFLSAAIFLNTFIIGPSSRSPLWFSKLRWWDTLSVSSSILLSGTDLGSNRRNKRWPTECHAHQLPQEIITEREDRVLRSENGTTCGGWQLATICIGNHKFSTTADKLCYVLNLDVCGTYKWLVRMNTYTSVLVRSDASQIEKVLLRLPRCSFHCIAQTSTAHYAVKATKWIHDTVACYRRHFGTFWAPNFLIGPKKKLVQVKQQLNKIIHNCRPHPQHKSHVALKSAPTSFGWAFTVLFLNHL